MVNFQLPEASSNLIANVQPAGAFRPALAGARGYYVWRYRNMYFAPYRRRRRLDF
jgi:hypothetical protein